MDTIHWIYLPAVPRIVLIVAAATPSDGGAPAKEQVLPESKRLLRVAAFLTSVALAGFLILH